MKKLKTTILTAFIALCCYNNVNAQATEGKNRGKVILVGSPGTFAVIGGGLLTPSSDAKDNTYAVNSSTINADVFLPLLRKEGSNFNFGVNLGGSYSFGGSGNPSTPLPAAYAVTGATSSSIAYRGVDPRNPGFKTGIGPQANFYLGKFNLSPMVLGEYFSMTQKELSAVQTTQLNGQSYDLNLATMPETKTSGFAITPKIRMQYMISQNFGFFADASYTMGPKIKTQVSQLIPNGNPTQNGTYELQALQTGTTVKGEIKETAFNAVGFNFGVVIGFGGNGHGADLANGVVKPACTCCGSFSHDRTSCPDISRCGNKTESALVPNTDLVKVDGDIKKGWNGNIAELFAGNYADIIVDKEGGVEKVIAQINKGGKGKASLEKYGDKQYVKIESKTEISYYPVDNSPQFTIINSGGFVCNSTCSSCGPVTNVGPCICNSPTGPISTGDEHPLPLACGTSISHPLTSYLTGADLDALAIPISTDNSGHLTSTSIKDIEQLVLAQMPHATAIKSELKKEDKTTYVETQFEDKGQNFVLISKIDLSGKKWLLKDKYLMMCAGTCNGTTYDCSLNGWGSVGSHVYCNCGTGCKFKIINFPNPISLDGGVKSVDLEHLIIFDGH